MISPGVFLYFLKNYNLVDINVLAFFYWPNSAVFLINFKFINKCETEILRCAQLSSHMCDFFHQGIALQKL